MNVDMLEYILDFKAITKPSGAEATSVFCCDLLSLAMSRASAGCVWVTVMGNVNTIAVAALAEVACVIFAEGVQPTPDCIARAEENGISLFTTAQPIFAAARAVDKCL